MIIVFASLLVKAQQPATIPIITKDHAFVLQTDKDGRLWITHFGKKRDNGQDYAQAAGVKFGIWIEPEMVNPKSELY